MQTLNDAMLEKLERTAKKRGITVQELVRAVIIPEWIEGRRGTSRKDKTWQGP